MRARILVLLTLVVVGVVGLFGGTAHAKGPSDAEITGEDITTPIPVPPEVFSANLIEETGFFAAAFGQEPNPMLATAPRGELGPRYTIVVEPAVGGRWTHPGRPGRTGRLSVRRRRTGRVHRAGTDLLQVRAHAGRMVPGADHARDAACRRSGSPTPRPSTRRRKSRPETRRQSPRRARKRRTTSTHRGC